MFLHTGTPVRSNNLTQYFSYCPLSPSIMDAQQSKYFVEDSSEQSRLKTFAVRPLWWREAIRTPRQRRTDLFDDFVAHRETIKSGMFRCATGGRSHGFAGTNVAQSTFPVPREHQRQAVAHPRACHEPYIH